MQDAEKKAAGPLGYDKTLVSLSVVSGALLLLMVIMLYLHFDAKITKLDHRARCREARHGSRLNRKMNFDFAGRKVVEADGGVSEYDPAMVR